MNSTKIGKLNQQRRPHYGLRSRRAFMQDGSVLLLSGMTTAGSSSFGAILDQKPLSNFALITDLHYADKPTAGSRHYRETLRKLAEAKTVFDRNTPEFLVCLGDLIDAASEVETELGYLSRIVKELNTIDCPKHFVLGNHCVDTLTKSEFLNGVGQDKSFYSFNRNGVHFVILDACFRSDGKPYQRKNFDWTDPNISEEQVQWLEADLADTKMPTIVFTHQRLDDAGVYSAKNAAVVRNKLEASNNVLAVFQGHSHKNEHQLIKGIHYCTMVAMVEGSYEQSNACSIVSVLPDGTVKVAGHRKQASYQWPAT